MWEHIHPFINTADKNLYYITMLFINYTSCLYLCFAMIFVEKTAGERGRAVRTADTLSGVSACTPAFDSAGEKPHNSRLTGLESRISVHPGCKDGVNEVFSGKITARRVICSEYGAERYKVDGSNAFHRLVRRIRYRLFSTKALTGWYGNRHRYTACGENGPSGGGCRIWGRGAWTDLVLILALTRRQGRDVYTWGARYT
jgi:hypothetical protein